MASAAGRRPVSGIDKMFQLDRLGRAEIRAVQQNILPFQPFQTLARTPGNDTQPINGNPNNNLHVSYAITAEWVGGIIINSPHGGIRAAVLDPYYAMICDYVNACQRPPRQLAGTPPYCAYMPRMFNTLGLEPDRQAWASNKASVDLNNAGYTLPVLRQMRYIFINLTVGGTAMAHAMLLAISPQAQTIELMDSGGISRHMNIYDDYFNLMNVVYGREFIPKDWRMRVNHTARQGKTPLCALYATANAMCLAFGYDNMLLKKYRPRFKDRRRWRFARELMNASFSDNPTSRFHYPLTTPRLDREISNGWTELTPEVLAALPITARARKGKYRHMQTKAAVKKHCQKSKRKYQGHNNWYRLPLAEFIEAVELRDYEIKTGAYIPH